MAFECDWYFDVVSPFSYFQWKTRSRFADDIRLRPIPVVLGPILRHWGQKGPAEIAPKRLQTYRSCQWLAGRLGVEFRFRPAHPFNPVSALRLIVALDAAPEAVEAVFDAAFRDGLDLTDVEVLTELGDRLGVGHVADAIADPALKQRLRNNTEAAIARGVFGVPTTAVHGELFWGRDSADMMLDFLRDPALFATPEMLRLQSLAAS